MTCQERNGSVGQDFIIYFFKLIIICTFWLSLGFTITGFVSIKENAEIIDCLRELCIFCTVNAQSPVFVCIVNIYRKKKTVYSCFFFESVDQYTVNNPFFFRPIASFPEKLTKFNSDISNE